MALKVRSRKRWHAHVLLLAQAAHVRSLLTVAAALLLGALAFLCVCGCCAFALCRHLCRRGGHRLANADEPIDDPLVLAIIAKHLHNLERRAYQAIARETGEPLEEVYEATKISKGIADVEVMSRAEAFAKCKPKCAKSKEQLLIGKPK